MTGCTERCVAAVFDWSVFDGAERNERLALRGRDARQPGDEPARNRPARSPG